MFSLKKKQTVNRIVCNKNYVMICIFSINNNIIMYRITYLDIKQIYQFMTA